jgi:hypothetical protein
MASDTVPLNWKRPPEWDRLVREGNRRLPSRDASTGIMIEMAWAEFQSDHRIVGIIKRFLDATDGLSAEGEGKKISRDRFSGDGRTTVRVDSSVKEEMKAYANEIGTDPHLVLRSVIANYLDDGLLSWAADQLEKLESRIDFSDLRRSAPERRRDEIIRALERITGDDEVTSFTFAEFDQAIDEGPKTPKTADDHAREMYLPLVLDKLGMTWHPDDDELFEKTDAVEETADIRRKPKALMDKRDTELALAIDAAEAADNSNRPIKYTKGDANALGGISYSNAEEYMRRVANWSGYKFDKREEVLKINIERITNRRVLDVIKSPADGWEESAVDELEEMGLDELLDPIVVNKIARAKYPDEAAQDDPIPDALLDRVTDKDVELVRDRLETDEDEQQDEIAAADERLHQLTNPQAFADGGTGGGEDDE